MNILYLCGSRQSMRETMRDWAKNNAPILQHMHEAGAWAELKNGHRVFFLTYDNPVSILNKEFGAVFTDGAQVVATAEQYDESMYQAYIRLRQYRDPITLVRPEPTA